MKGLVAYYKYFGSYTNQVEDMNGFELRKDNDFAPKLVSPSFLRLVTPLPRLKPYLFHLQLAPLLSSSLLYPHCHLIWFSRKDMSTYACWRQFNANRHPQFGVW